MARRRLCLCRRVQPPARTPDERGRAPDQAVEWTDVLWLIELKTEKASHSPPQIPDSLALARHHHPGKQIFLTYLTPPATYVFDLPDWVTFAAPGQFGSPRTP